MTTSEIASFIQRLMRRELGKGELAALTTRDLDDINTYLAERAKASRQTQPDSPHSAHHNPHYSTQQNVQQRVETLQRGLQTFKAARIYSEKEILLELGVSDQPE